MTASGGYECIIDFGHLFSSVDFTYPSTWGGGVAGVVGGGVLAGRGAAAALWRAPFGGGICVDWWLACGVLQWFSVMRPSHCWLAFGRGAAGARGVVDCRGG